MVVFVKLNNDLGGNNLIYKDGDFYIQNRGADTGLKKLGSVVFESVSFSSSQSPQTITLVNPADDLTIDEIFFNDLTVTRTIGGQVVQSFNVKVNSYNPQTKQVTIPVTRTANGLAQLSGKIVYRSKS